VRVLVLGAGIIGVSIAEQLASRGAEVSVIDMRSPGRGATQASAGMLAPFLEADPGSPLLALGTRSLAMFDPWVARAGEASGKSIEYARTGTLEVAFDEAESKRLREALEWLTSIGVGAEWLDATTLRQQEPAVADAALGALRVAAHGLVGVASLLGALVESARLAGATFMSPVEVLSVEPRTDVVHVHGGAHRDAADAVVIATGSWSRRVRVAGVSALPLRPVRGQLLHLRWTSGVRPSRVIWGPACYVVPWSDGSLLVGATVEDAGFDETSTVAGVESLARAATALLPAAASASIEAIRVGLRPATPDGLPIIGPMARAPRVVVATGHYRNGILLAPLTADLVVRHLLDGETDPSVALTTPNRFTA
jgi:glycine oxidase